MPLRHESGASGCLGSQAFQIQYMNRFPSWMSYVSRPVLWIVLRIVTRFGKNPRLRIGKLLILGPPSFVALCKESIERLHGLDPDLHRHLTEHEKVCISHDPERLSDMPDWRMFTVTDRYVAWREDGIISRLVYINFKISIFPRYSIQDRAKEQARQKSVVAQWKLWLESHNFPAVLGN
jgi:hypothetical protein